MSVGVRKARLLVTLLNVLLLAGPKPPPAAVKMVYLVEVEGAKVPLRQHIHSAACQCGGSANGEQIVLPRGIGVDPEERAGLKIDIATDVQGLTGRSARRHRATARYRNIAADDAQARQRAAGIHRDLADKRTIDLERATVDCGYANGAGAANSTKFQTPSCVHVEGVEAFEITAGAPLGPEGSAY